MTVVVKKETEFHFAGLDSLGFETVTMVPLLARNLIVCELLSERERVWVDSYHATVWSKLSPLLEAQVHFC